MTNIKFNYLYRDAGNYKKWGQVIFSNPDGLTEDFLTRELRRAFLQDGLFVADQIRVPDSFLYLRGESTSDDHCYHEFDSVEMTDDGPSDECVRSIRQFLEEVRMEATKGWTAFDPHDSLHP